MSFDIYHKKIEKDDFIKIKDLNSSYYEESHPIHQNDYMDWLYLNNPFDSATAILVEEEGIYIGIMVLIPIILMVNKKEQKSCFAINVLSHPEHRKKNLFIKMIDYTKKYLSEENIWLIGHPNRQAVPGWKRKKMSFKASLEAKITKVRLPFSGYKEVKVNCASELTLLPKSLWNEMDNSGVKIKNTPDFIKWKYFDAPHTKYLVSKVIKNDVVIALKVYKYFKGPIKLLLHVITNTNDLAEVSKCRFPSIHMVPKSGGYKESLNSSLFNFTLKKEIPFFVSSWKAEYDDSDFSCVTLAASDF